MTPILDDPYCRFYAQIDTSGFAPNNDHGGHLTSISGRTTSMLTISALTARRFMQLATGLNGKFSDMDAALDHLGFVQIDPINVCGRMQDHILRHRVRGYREGDCMRHLHSPSVRTAFEHHLPDSGNLAALPLDAWPYLQRSMQERSRCGGSWSGKLTHAEKKLAATILVRMATEGTLCSQDIDSTRKDKTHAWDSTTLAKSTLQKLFFHGRILIARRDSNRRYYDLPEHILPSSSLNVAIPTDAETTRWLALLKLRQRRLAALKAAELRAIADEVIPVRVHDIGAPRLHLLRSDSDLLAFAAGTTKTALKPLLLAPLDPVIYDRRVTESVWAFDYRWEVYVPPQKRVRGYYALPLLRSHRFIGHADVKADRSQGKLAVISQQTTSATHARNAVKSLADFLGLKAEK